MTEKKSGLTRRVFINRSVGAAGGAMVLSALSTMPAWADEYEGAFTRMGQLACDHDDGTMYKSMLRIDLDVQDLDTEFGPPA